VELVCFTNVHDILILTEPVGWGNAKIITNAFLILTAPVELVGMLKSQLKISGILEWVGGNAKINLNTFSTKTEWSWLGMSTQSSVS
jgi:hypothetical protein